MAHAAINYGCSLVQQVYGFMRDSKLKGVLPACEDEGDK